jgi:hypothetical protein
MFGPFPRPLAILIMTRIMTLNRRFAGLAGKILAGTFVPRRPPAAPRRSPAPHPRKPDKLPRKLGWLPGFLPDTRAYAAQLSYLLDDPATVELIRSGPPSLARPLRSLCRMLGVTPPPLLAIPRPKPAAPRPKPAKPPPPPPPPEPPAWMPRRTRWTLARIRGSPKPA